MRGLWTLLLFVALALAGCADDNGNTDDDSDGTDTGTGTPEPIPPEDIHDSQTIAGADVQNQNGEPPCSLPSEQCIEYPFTVEGGKVQVEATLTWLNPGSDFDLYLMKADGTQVTSSGDFPPETEEAFTVSVGSGDYEVWVVPWAVAADTYELDVVFT